MTNFLTEIIVNVNTRRIIDFINDNYFWSGTFIAKLIAKTPPLEVGDAFLKKM